jgi:hypothetical protein
VVANAVHITYVPILPAVGPGQREPPAETTLAVADREHESADDQPHRALGKSAQHPAQRFVRIGFDIAHDARDRQPDQADRADRHRFQDQAGDHGGKYRKIMPLVEIEAGRYRHQIDREPDRQRRDGLPANFHKIPSGSRPAFPARPGVRPRRLFLSTVA